MSIRRAFLVLGCLMIMLLACSSFAAAANTVDVSYNLSDLGGGDYLYTFIFTNNGPANDAIFKIAIDNVPQGVTSLGFTAPTGWSSSLNGKGLAFQTDNGSLSASKGINRIWGESGAPYGPGNTTGTFTWKFNSATAPSATQFGDSNFIVHLQTVDSNWANNGKSYPTNPTPEPSGLLALATGLTGIGGLVWKRRK